MAGKGWRTTMGLKWAGLQPELPLKTEVSLAAQ